MRLSRFKVYRAFPELDPFSDEECERYFARAKRSYNPVDEAILPVVTMIGLFFGVVGAASAWYWRDSLFFGRGGLPTLVGFGWTVAAVLMVVAWSGLRRFRLRRLLRQRLAAHACPSCRASLLGARCEWGIVHCPKCAGRLELRRIGQTAEDLLTIDAGADGRRLPLRAACPLCEAMLVDAPIERGGVRCPKCGHRCALANLPASPVDFRVRGAIDALNGRPFPLDRVCPSCRYPLKGLRVTDGGVECPECAHRSVVREFAFTPDERKLLLNDGAPRD